MSCEDAYQYDLVILGDVDASFFTEEELGVLEKLIRDRGASLLMLCGPMHSPGSYAGTPVETMLPVRFEAEAAWETVTETVYPVLTPEGITSQVMTLENDAELNDRVWSRMAPMDQLPPLLSVKPEPPYSPCSRTIRTVTKPTRSWHGNAMERASTCQSPRTVCGVLATGQETSTIGVYGPNASNS